MPEGKPPNISKPSLLFRLAAELERGSRLIASIDDAAYLHASEYTGTVGAHFRHNLDVVNRLLEGIESGCVDYARRERDPQIENDRSYAIALYREVIEQIQRLIESRLAAGVSVRSETDPNVWLPSSFGREVEYVHSHTVHHHALIAEKLSAVGVEMEKSFGVAPSTLEYWADKKD